MAQRPLKILLLFDLSVAIKREDYADYLKTEDWKNEAHIIHTLEKLGHEVLPLGIHDSIEPLLELLPTLKPDLVFNLSEAFRADRRFEPHLAALLELLDLRYTGSGPSALHLCKDKGLTKKLLSYHHIRAPKFIVSERSRPLRSLGGFTFPAFIKPLLLEASEGISQVSFAENEKDALERVRFIHDRLETDAIVEEYIEGRELYVGVLGNDRLTVLPPRELFFKEVPEGEPKFATFRAKWDESYRKRWGIDSGPARQIPPEVWDRISEACKKVYRVLQLRGYGRIDLRLKPTGEFYFIEANPNPSIAKDDDFAQAALKGGIDYPSLVSKILSLA